jgi:transcriptional regulatory protein LevR
MIFRSKKSSKFLQNWNFYNRNKKFFNIFEYNFAKINIKYEIVF